MRRLLFVVASAVLGFAAAGVSPAAADLAQPTVVSENPVDFTPHVLNGSVWTMAALGDIVVVGGDFTQITDSSRQHQYARRNLMAFNLKTGAILPFAPSVDGPVYAVAAGEDGSIYAGGAFGIINGVRQRGLARLNLAGSRLEPFHSSIDHGAVQKLAVHGHRLYAAGTFAHVNGVPRVGLARLDAVSGAVDTGFDARLSGSDPDRDRVESFDISPDGRFLVAIGAFLRSGSTDRSQIAVFDISGPSAALTGWYTDAFKQPCGIGFAAYLRQVKYSPDGSYFVVVTTGGTSSPVKLCDAAARFQAGGSGRHDPVWVQRTGGNSLFAVAVTGAAVYVGGHQLYLDNPLGHKSKLSGQKAVFRPGPGAVSRPGIGAVDPATGRALPWNPTRTRGTGVRVFLAVPGGLLVGSDTDQLGHEFHGRMGMFPIS